MVRSTSTTLLLFVSYELPYDKFIKVYHWMRNDVELAPPQAVTSLRQKTSCTPALPPQSSGYRFCVVEIVLEFVVIGIKIIQYTSRLD